MKKIRLKSAYFKQLKGLREVEILFEKPLTAIMGVNGSGKTTVIHALACIYEPNNKGEKHRFPDFFVPNTDAIWTGSELYVVNEYQDENEDWVATEPVKYEKAVDRWTPRYANRVKRDTYYIGIDTCLPEIEKKTLQSRIKYSTKAREDKLAKKIIEIASDILNKDYDTLMDNIYHNRHFNGVSLSNGLKYSSLSMGTGEQRTIKILEKVLAAESYSLILIDEIDLLLHVSALNRLVKQLYEIAQKRNLQIVFTTHSLQMEEFSDIVGIQYLNSIKLQDGSIKTMVYKEISSDLIYDMTGENTQPLNIFVEDSFAKAIIRKIARQLSISAKVKLVIYGAIENAFTLASAKVLAGEDVSNILIVLDGDKYKCTEEKMKQIKKHLTGTEENIEERRKRALMMISQFSLPDGETPESFLRNLLLECGTDESELVVAANQTHTVRDSHDWIRDIQRRLNDSEENIIRDIVDIVSESGKWKEYINPVQVWLQERINL